MTSGPADITDMAPAESADAVVAEEEEDEEQDGEVAACERSEVTSVPDWTKQTYCRRGPSSAATAATAATPPACRSLPTTSVASDVAGTTTSAGSAGGSGDEAKNDVNETIDGLGRLKTGWTLAVVNVCPCRSSTHSAASTRRSIVSLEADANAGPDQSTKAQLGKWKG